MKVYFWCPFINPVATVTAVLNSIISLNKFSKNKRDYKIINVFKEWSMYGDELKKNQIDSIDLGTSLNIQFLPKHGYIRSRITYIITYLFSIFLLHRLIKREKPNFFIIHLISSIPLSLLLFFNYNTKFILRISGYPKMNFFRKLLWKFCNNKLDKIFCPTQLTKDFLIKNKIFAPEKIFLVKDPIINLNQINKNKKHSFEPKDNWLKDMKYIISIGRLTIQKDYSFLLNEFSKLKSNYPKLNLIIIGEGEEKDKLKKIIDKNNLHNRVFLLGKKKNIYPYLLNSLFFILTSKWEDPGFVIIESMFSRKLVLSSNCESGPTEIIKNDENGFVFEKNNSKDFKKKFSDIYDISVNSHDKEKRIILNGIKTSRCYTLFNHFKDISPHLIK